MAESTRRRRILVLAPFPPQLDGRHGGSRAIARLIVGLSERNDVALAYVRAGDEPPIDRELASYCEKVLGRRRPGTSRSAIRPLTRIPLVSYYLARGIPLWIAGRWSAAFAHDLRNFARIWRPDVMQAEFTAMGGYLAVANREAVRVVTVHEPGAAAALERADERGGLLRRFWESDARRWLHHDAAVIRRADAAVVFTERDRLEISRLNTGTQVTHIPVAPQLPPEPADPRGADPPELLFVGHFAHPPNVDAALHLMRDIFPPLRARFPELKLRLVGDAVPASLRNGCVEGVDVMGWVPDLSRHMNNAAVLLAPLRQGGGMRVKVMDALAAGKALVAYPLAVEGFDIVAGQHALVAQDAHEFIDHVAMLLSNVPHRICLAAAARDWALSAAVQHGSCIAYDHLYDSLLRMKRGPAGEKSGSTG